MTVETVNSNKDNIEIKNPEAKAGNARLVMQSFGTKLLRRERMSTGTSTAGAEFVITGFCIYKFKRSGGKTIPAKDIVVDIGRNERHSKIRMLGKGVKLVKGFKLGRYEIAIDEADVTGLDIQNKIQIRYGDETARIAYSILDRTRGRQKTSKIYRTGDLACYLKQSIYNGMYLTVREPQIYDDSAARRRVFAAWILAKIWPKRDLIYLYEKECSRYEESASILYERLIDEGYNNAYFVVNEGNPAIASLDDKYKQNLIYKDSFKHLLYFFKSKKFFSSETMSHAMQLRASDKRIVRKTESRNISYVFLQHGVMYMISLDADLRVSFKQRGLNFYKVIVSSQLEADHFIELGGFSQDELYVTGLAKFDKSVRFDNADRIVIMPTWRRWESNQAREDFAETKYYKMIERMVNAVPDEYREKIVILPHPLMQQAMNAATDRTVADEAAGGITDLGPYMATKSHDATLKECDLLITDYSSIAYDAFYRGCNVVFYWEEKDECLKHYGEETKLLLNEENAFGDVCYNAEELAKAVEHNYKKSQTQEYQDKYARIVEFHDGKNTERIVELLRRDGAI